MKLVKILTCAVFVLGATVACKPKTAATVKTDKTVKTDAAKTEAAKTEAAKK
jgi:hypothetical protein